MLANVPAMPPSRELSAVTRTTAIRAMIRAYSTRPWPSSRLSIALTSLRYCSVTNCIGIGSPSSFLGLLRVCACGLTVVLLEARDRAGDAFVSALQPGPERPQRADDCD